MEHKSSLLGIENQSYRSGGLTVRVLSRHLLRCDVETCGVQHIACRRGNAVGVISILDRRQILHEDPWKYSLAYDKYTCNVLK